MHIQCIGVDENEFKKLNVVLKKHEKFLKTSCSTCSNILSTFGKMAEELKSVKDKEKANEEKIEKQREDFGKDPRPT